MGNSSVIDPEVISSLRELGGKDDPGFFAKLIRLFLDGAPPRLQGIGAAILADLPKQLETEAHALKSSAGNLGARELVSLCSRLEQIGRSGTTAGAQPIFDQIQRNYREIEAEIYEFPELKDARESEGEAA